MAKSTLDVVIEYLAGKFPDQDMSGEEPDDTGDIRLTIGEMTLRVTLDFLDAVEPGEVDSVLDWLDVAGELRRAQGLPMVLTGHGVRLESAN